MALLLGKQKFFQNPTPHLHLPPDCLSAYLPCLGQAAGETGCEGKHPASPSCHSRSRQLGVDVGLTNSWSAHVWVWGEKTMAAGITLCPWLSLGLLFPVRQVRLWGHWLLCPASQLLEPHSMHWILRATKNSCNSSCPQHSTNSLANRFPVF